MEYLFWVIVFILGATMGGFLNVYICRLPTDESVVYPPSHCPTCGNDSKLLGLIPILSYVYSKGSCRSCGCRISPRYLLVEVFTGLLFVISVAKYGVTLDALRTILLISVLIPAAAIDFRCKIIPDQINLAGFMLGIPLILESKIVFLSSVTGFFVGGGVLFLLAVISRGGMGGGDIKLAAVMGLLLGWEQVLLALFLASLLGSIVGLTLLMLKVVSRKDTIPFGPYLALGALITALEGDKLIQWYTGF